MTDTTIDTRNKLAASCGIASEYHDIFGNHHQTSEQTCQALLAAMHLAADSDPAVLLQQQDAAAWQQALPPVCVVQSGATARIVLNLPKALVDRAWCWTIELESGSRRTAEFIPADLPCLGEQLLADVLLTRHELELPAVDVEGYHRLRLCLAHRDAATVATVADESYSMSLIVVPQRCYQPEAMRDGGRIWGLTAQLYGVRSKRNWGIGDFTDLGQLIELTGSVGGAIVGVNPLHALFPDNPAHISPYSPSQRSFINVLYLDVEAVAEFPACSAAQHRVAGADFQARLRALRAATLVDYVGVAQAKFEILKLLFARFLADAGPRASDFAAWRSAQGDELERHARYEALQAHFRAGDAKLWGWPVWPVAYRDPESPSVTAFAAAHADAVTWYAWLQWLADTQLAAVAARSKALGLAVGIYRDLAVGAHPGGAESWSGKDVFADGAHAGAPPDEINSIGQDWGLPPFVPQRLRAAAYRPFITMLRANMKHAGALRIDHVKGLMRVFWVPANLPASAGAYVHYPFEDMLGIVALESQRNQCLVIGEDLGTVPDGFRPRLAECGMLSYHPLIFERYPDGNFRLPADVPAQSLVAVSTHDLPTLRGYWQGKDLDWRAALQLFPHEQLRQQLITERDWDRGRLLWALERENLLPAGVSKNPAETAEIDRATVLAVHAYLARTPAQIMVVQPEDIFGVMEQPNLPGTLEHQHPNWQRRLPLALEDWPAERSLEAFAHAIRGERGEGDQAGQSD